MSARLVTAAMLALASACAFGAGEDDLASALRARFPELTRVELVPLSRAPAGEVEIPAELALEKRIHTWVSSKPRRTGQWWALKAFAPVLVARRTLRPGEAVQPSDLAAEERDIAGTGGALLTADPGLAAARWRATRMVQPGMPLRRSDLEPAPEVLRGQEVRVSLVSELFVIHTTGIARDEGRLGAVIAVTRPGTPEPYFAVVTGEREVTLRGKP